MSAPTQPPHIKRRVLSDWLLGRDQSLCRWILQRWHRTSRRRRACRRHAFPIFIRQAQCSIIFDFRTSWSRWTALVSEQRREIESSNNIRSHARMIYRVYRRRRIFDPMQQMYRKWYEYTHVTFPRVVSETSFHSSYKRRQFLLTFMLFFFFFFFLVGMRT